MKYIYFLILFFLGTNVFAGCETPPANKKELNILTYNIKMLPRFLIQLKHHPIKRAKLIPAELLSDTIDVIIFQEAFDRKAIRILKRKLKEQFPYIVGPANKKFFSFKISSGVMMFSRFPIKEVGSVDYKDCDKEDCMARKGALLVEADWQGMKLQLMGTHAEAGGSRQLKIGQYYEMHGLMKEHEKAGVPQFFCGDFNTHKGTDLYDSLLTVLGAEDGGISGDLKFSSDHLINDMGKFNPKKRGVIDFILYKGNGIIPQTVSRTVRRYECAWDSKHCDLSDHLAILMNITF